MREYVFTVDRGGKGKRLDIYLQERLPRFARAFIQRLIVQGEVSVRRAERADETILKRSFKLNAGDAVKIVVPSPKPSRAEPEPIPITVIYEDDALAVVNKRAGIVVHPAPGNRSGTLVNALLYHFKRLSSISGVLRPGIVHRLDRDVSGLILVAKTDASHRALVQAFKNREVEKIYLALVLGRVRARAGKIDAPIGRNPHNRKKMAVISAGRPAQTFYRVLEWIKDATLVELNLKTGRSHQARVHLSHIGHPVAGDSTYGGKRILAEDMRDAIKNFNRIALHAFRLTLRHPATKLPVSFEAPLPDEFKTLISQFKARAPK